ncbi:MAG TPA: Ig-like domain-containing protein, partial [Gemmatimonadaceae bacterium]|nr:Ig-like domain-containing protein [Gemmatimonadaceae bacterium]
MRASLRLAGYALLLLSGVTCTESPTAPRNARHGMTASLSLQPSFSRDAQAALSNLGAFGLNVDNVHIHIEHPPAAPLDTVIPFPANADSIVLSLSIQLNAPTEQLSALIELRQGAQVLFSGTQTLFASVTGTPSQPSSPVPITYVGPGASARTLHIAPRDTAIIGAGSFAYRYALLDANGSNVVGAQPAWSISDPTIGSIDPATGLFTASGKRGTARIVAATINGLRDSTTVVVANQPTKLVAVSGTGQTAAAGTPLAQPLVVQAQASDGSAVPGVRVNFATTVAGASFNPVSGVTDLNGNLQTTVTLGHTAGAQAFTALSAGLTSATATETATAAAAAQLAKVSGDLQSDSINAVLPQPFVVRVTDAYGNVASGATVNWTRIAGGGTLAATTSASDSTGIARVGYTLGTTARTDSVQAALVGVNAATALFTARSYAAGPTAIAIASGDAQSADAGTPLP